MKRLDKIVSYIDENKIVADIGSDHGISAIKVYEEKKPKRVIATDISANSLQKLRDKLEYSNYDIETVVTDGLKGLSGDIEQIIISGMGGRLIMDILEGNMPLAKSAEKIITSPNNSQNFYREWLHNNGFEILEDDRIEDEEIIYDIIVVAYRGQVEPYSDKFHYIYGKENIEEKRPLTIKTLENDIEHNKYILSCFEGKDTEKIRNRRQEIIKENKELEELLCELRK